MENSQMKPVKKLGIEELDNVSGGTSQRGDGMLSTLIQVLKYDIGISVIEELVRQSKAAARDYVAANALPYMRVRCPNYTDAQLQSIIEQHALRAINSIL